MSKTIPQKITFALLMWPICLGLIPVAYAIDGREGVGNVLYYMKRFETP